MTTSQARGFEALCRSSLEDILLEFRYVYRNSYTRCRGVALEFGNNANRCFVACEGNAVYMDLILQLAPSVFLRVSVNQALWFNGVKTVSQPASVQDQLVLFGAELRRCCGSILAGDLSALDPRYCFRVSREECHDYVAVLTGC